MRLVLIFSFRNKKFRLLRYRVEIFPSTPGGSQDLTADRRKMFARSKSVKTCCSMPVPVQLLNDSSLFATILINIINPLAD